MSAQAGCVVKAADGAYIVGGAHVNWVILAEGGGLGLVDAG
ncbi:hypothetical protein ACIBFB_16260 [Nocardiopsis sp. NPDC050513]